MGYLYHITKIAYLYSKNNVGNIKKMYLNKYKMSSYPIKTIIARFLIDINKKMIQRTLIYVS